MVSQITIRLCKKGDRKAQKELFDLLAPFMLSVCRRYTKDIDDAEDILQDGFIKMFTKIHQYDDKGPFEAWVRKIIVNTAINFISRNKRYTGELLYTEGIVETDGDENLAISKLGANELLALIGQLPSGYKTVFNLVAIDGYKYNQVAEMLKITESTARSQYMRARRILIQQITNHEADIEQERYLHQI
jgi:RNA polymerase sigma factor (sigma-70 family)